jgi:hypothetical protein
MNLIENSSIILVKDDVHLNDPAPIQSGDRWASLDEDEDDYTIGLSETISLELDPDTKDFASTVSEFMEHASVYGVGWVLALQISIFINPSDH